MTQPPPWPQADLETVPNCPVCGAASRSLLYSGLSDRVFGVADGTWTLYRCAQCASAYLDPRPTPDSIGRAYTGYYTHAAEDHPIVRRKGRIRSLLHDLINGYQNHRYGVQRSPASPLGRWLLPLLPSLRAAADAECRHLPPLPAGGGRLLDVGCGNGGFLALAQQAGWTVQGVDFDPEAERTARSRGLDVRVGGIEVLHGETVGFDVVTMSHVIEHVFQPLQTAQRVHALLKPGGVFWLDTPNIRSLGAKHYGVDWRGLETPRHLVLFNPHSLRSLLREAGFHQVRQHWRGMTVFNVFAESEAMRKQGMAVGASSDGKPPLAHVLAELREMVQPSRREFLTFSARK
ncbi:MAG: class I SAM-dependent methyltransferase [Pseudomonadota bacterium]